MSGDELLFGLMCWVGLGFAFGYFLGKAHTEKHLALGAHQILERSARLEQANTDLSDYAKALGRIIIKMMKNQPLTEQDRILVFGEGEQS